MSKTALLACAGFLWLLPSLVASAVAADTNLVLSRTLNLPVVDVRAAIEAYANPTNSGTRPWRTNDLPGVSYSASFMDCTPPFPMSSFLAHETKGLLMTLGWKPPLRGAYYAGTFVATRVSAKMTRLDVFERGSFPTNDTARAKCYVEGIVAQLPKEE